MITSKDKLEKAEKALVEIGFDHFIILTPPDDDGKLSATFHQMKSAETVNVFINFLLQAIDHELAANPDYSKEYKKIFTDFKGDFMKIVTTVNKKVAKFDINQQNEN